MICNLDVTEIYICEIAFLPTFLLTMHFKDGKSLSQRRQYRDDLGLECYTNFEKREDVTLTCNIKPSAQIRHDTDTPIF